MKYAKVLGVGLLAATLAVVGCKGGTGTTGGTGATPGGTRQDTPSEKEHVHGNGPHDGVTFDLGKYHAELTIDHGKKEMTIYFLKEVQGKKEKEWPQEPVDCKELTVTTKETKGKDGKVVPAMTIKLDPQDVKDGKSSRFVGTNDGLGHEADHQGTVLGKIGGQPSEGEFKE
jgi:hypothetical protein